MDLLGREGYSKNGKTLSGMKESHSLTTNVINYAVVHHNEKLDSYHLYASYDLYTCYNCALKQILYNSSHFAYMYIYMC